MTIATPKRETLTIRIKPADRARIDRAAELTGRTRADFVLEAATRAAEEALMDQTLFLVSPDAFAEFVARLDAPPAPNPRLLRALNTPASWD